MGALEELIKIRQDLVNRLYEAEGAEYDRLLIEIEQYSFDIQEILNSQ